MYKEINMFKNDNNLVIPVEMNKKIFNGYKEKYL